jgi:inosine-uridine nucleoside N-ribohydrolase
MAWRRSFLVSILVVLGVTAQDQTNSIIIDTDAGSDDLMAIAFLLAHPSVHIEAITVANGLAHVDAGASNIVRLERAQRCSSVCGAKHAVARHC